MLPTHSSVPEACGTRTASQYFKSQGAVSGARRSWYKVPLFDLNHFRYGPLLERYAADPDLQKSYGRACELAGDKVRASEAYAEAAYLNGHAEDALSQLKSLSKSPDLTFYQRSRVDARITQLTPEVLALRKRSTPDPDPAGSLSLTCCGNTPSQSGSEPVVCRGSKWAHQQENGVRQRLLSS